MENNHDTTLQQEQERLLQIQEIIGHEIEERLRNLSDLKQEIVDYRKFLIEEIPQKQYHSLNQDNPVREASYKATYERLGALSRMYYYPYFGKIVLKDPLEAEEEEYFIGKNGLEQHGNPIILDWRAPMASLFYQQRLGMMEVKAPLATFEVELLKRRQYIIRAGVMKGLFDSEIDIKDDILQMVLSGNSGARLKDIIATIQKEQDDIIREPLEHNVLLNGVAGSGKTTIILHRIAYLLFNYRARLQDNILIIGPNRLFMEYISDVLPDLGEKDNTFQLTIPQLAKEVVHPVREVMSTEEYFRRLEAAQPRFIKEVQRKSSASFKKELDDAFRAFEEAQLKKKDLCFQEQVIISAEEMNQVFTKTYSKLPYLRRIRKIRRLILQRVKDLRNDTVRRLKRVYDIQIRKAREEADFARVDRLQRERQETLRGYLREVYLFMKEIRGLYDVPETEEWYARTVRKGDSQPWIEDDLCGLLYVFTKLHGKGSYPVRHLVIDEAQDVSAFGFLMLKSLTGADTYTIVGDVHQRIKGEAHHSMMIGWEKLMRPQERQMVSYYELHRSYRSTPQIMEYAEHFLPDKEKAETIDREGTPVEERDFAGTKDLGHQIKQILAQMREAGMERMAILCGTDKEAERIGRAVRKLEPPVQIVREDQMALDAEVSAMPVYYAKGLEFDGVIVVESKDSHWDPWTQYILCTRALHRLVYMKETEGEA